MEKNSAKFFRFTREPLYTRRRRDGKKCKAGGQGLSPHPPALLLCFALLSLPPKGEGEENKREGKAPPT